MYRPPYWDRARRTTPARQDVENEWLSVETGGEPPPVGVVWLILLGVWLIVFYVCAKAFRESASAGHERQTINDGAARAYRHGAMTPRYEQG
jgi:hypothetical protein